MNFGLRFKFRTYRLRHFYQVGGGRNGDRGIIALAARGAKRYDNQQSYGPQSHREHSTTLL
jgi:Ser-tRNA(Ala) deacylase AlaX